MLKYYTIYGERCSGTNYLEDIMTKNFDVELTWKYGHKHFFGFNDLTNSDNTLFICIVRHPVNWVNSFFRDKHHVAFHLRKDIHTFINNEFSSFHHFKTHKEEILEDRNIYTGNKYENLFELRHTKLKYLMDDLPNKVKNMILIKYEDLVENFDNTMKRIADKGCKIKNSIEFPLNSKQYKNTADTIYKNKAIVIDEDLVLKNKYFKLTYEKKLNYIL